MEMFLLCFSFVKMDVLLWGYCLGNVPFHTQPINTPGALLGDSSSASVPQKFAYCVVFPSVGVGAEVLRSRFGDILIAGMLFLQSPSHISYT